MADIIIMITGILVHIDIIISEFESIIHVLNKENKHLI